MHPAHRRRGHARALLHTLIERHRCAQQMLAMACWLHKRPVDRCLCLWRAPSAEAQTAFWPEHPSSPHSPMFSTPCRRDSAGWVLLEVRASNDPALALYSSMGFQKVGLRRRYYSKPEEDAVLMTLTLGGGA